MSEGPYRVEAGWNRYKITRPDGIVYEVDCSPELEDELNSAFAAGFEAGLKAGRMEAEL